MKLVLADPPRKGHYYDNSYPNIGILYLIAYLRANYAGELEIHYLESDLTPQEHLEAVRAIRPEVYGLSFAFWTAPLAHATMDSIKAALPECLVICGGAQPTADCHTVFAKSRVDACVLGEGEATLLELVERLAAGQSLEGLPGLALRRADGGVEVFEKRQLIKRLDDIPLPAWDLVDFRKYSGMHIHKAQPQTHILVSRGCPFDCNFCSNPVWKLNKPWFRLRSASNIATEIKLLYDRGIREIYMTSDEFNVSEKWALEVSEAIAALNLPDLYLQCNVRADCMSPALAKAFKRINIWLVHLGIESGNQHTLEQIGKKVTLEQIVETCRLLGAEGIQVFGFVMLYHAWEEDGQLRWEGNEEVSKTLRFVRELFRRKLMSYMSWQVATPMPGSRLHRTAVKYGLIPDKTISGVWARNLNLPGIGDQDVKRYLRRGMFMKNWYLLKNGNINLAHLDRALRNLKVILGRPVG